MTNSVDPDLFCSADDIFRCIFFLVALRVKIDSSKECSVVTEGNMF